MEDKTFYTNGFGLMGLLLLGLIAGMIVLGVTYFKPIKQEKSVIQKGIEAEKTAEELKKQIEFRHQQQFKLEP